MTAKRNENLKARLTADDACSAKAAGVEFARRLSGAGSADFTLALADQEYLVKRAIIEAGHNDDQARLAARYFATAARAEWARVTSAAGHGLRGQA